MEIVASQGIADIRAYQDLVVQVFQDGVVIVESLVIVVGQVSRGFRESLDGLVSQGFQEFQVGQGIREYQDGLANQVIRALVEVEFRVGVASQGIQDIRGLVVGQEK